MSHYYSYVNSSTRERTYYNEYHIDNGSDLRRRHREREYIVCKETYSCYSEQLIQVYTGVTKGQARRILRNHRLRFNPCSKVVDCGMGFRKMKQKIYIGSAGMNYNKGTLTIRNPIYYKITFIKREAYIEQGI